MLCLRLMNSAEKLSPVIESTFNAHLELVGKMPALFPEIQKAAEMTSACLGTGGVIFLCGNGGSAADAQHIAGEFVGRFYLERRGLPAMALHTDTTILTAVANDYGFEAVYARQLEAHGKAGDLLMAISTSGNSPNILRAAEKAKELGMKVLGLTGEAGGTLKLLCDLCLCVPSKDTPRVQEMHITIGHILCQIAEAEMSSRS